MFHYALLCVNKGLDLPGTSTPMLTSADFCIRMLIVADKHGRYMYIHAQNC